MKKSLPAWERDGRELKSLPSVTRQQRSTRQGSGSTDTSATSDGSRTAVNASAVQTAVLKREVVAKSNLWTCLKIRPTTADEVPGRMIRADQVDRSVRITTTSGSSITQKADQVYGPSASQAEINTTICIETVPAIFSGAGSAVVYLGPRGSGKTSGLFAGPMEIPDPVAVPVTTASGWPESRKSDADSAAISSTHFGGLVPAFLSDILRRVADLTLYDITVSVQMISIEGDSVIDLMNSDKESSQVALQDSDMLGATSHEIETAADFGRLWGTTLENAANSNSPDDEEMSESSTPVICCIVSIERVDIRNGAVTLGTQLFLDIPPPESSTAAKLSSAALTKVLCTIGIQEPDADLRKIFIPWRDSKLTRVMHAAMSRATNNSKIPKMMIVGMLSPTDDEVGVHASLATSSLISSISKNRKGTASTESAKEAARRMQLRLETLCEAHRREWSDTQEELIRLRRENVLLKSGSSAGPPKGNASIAKVLQVLLKEKIFKPEPGEGATMALISQLLSQLVVRERKINDADCLSGERWLEIISALQKAEPSIIPQKPPHRAVDNPLKAAVKNNKGTFLNWYKNSPASTTSTLTPTPKPETSQSKRDSKEEAFNREVSWLKSNSAKPKKVVNSVVKVKDVKPKESESRQQRQQPQPQQQQQAELQSQPRQEMQHLPQSFGFLESNSQILSELPAQLGLVDDTISNSVPTVQKSQPQPQLQSQASYVINKKSKSYVSDLQPQQSVSHRKQEDLLQSWTLQQQSIDEDVALSSAHDFGSRLASRSGSDGSYQLSGRSHTSRSWEDEDLNGTTNFRSVRDLGFGGISAISDSSFPTAVPHSLSQPHDLTASSVSAISAPASVTSQLDDAIESAVESLCCNQVSEIHPGATPRRQSDSKNAFATNDGDEYVFSYLILPLLCVGFKTSLKIFN